jgi:putative CocE/NonD family hydrolase
VPEPSLRIERNQEMRARDGTVLRADVIRPDIAAKVPAIVARTPYEKTNTFLTLRYLPPLVAAENGFAFVVQDIRGRFTSEGEWDFVNLREANIDDGYDTIEWVASQAWCDSNVSMAGGSYVGVTQLSAAFANPPSLRAIAPSLLGMGARRALTHSLPLESMTVGWMAGLAIDRLTKLMAVGQASPTDIAKVMEAMQRPDRAAGVLPLDDLLTLESTGMPAYSMVHALVANTAQDMGIEHFRVPALWTSGWYDNAGGGELYRDMRDRAATELARTETRMILGPWTHNYAEPFVGSFGTGAFGSAAGSGVHQWHLAFYSRHLRGDDVDLPAVRYFVIGPNEWRQADDWPVPGTERRPLYLHSAGKANGHAGDGGLSWSPPAGSQAPDRYQYDPADPVPSWGFRVMYTGGSTVSGPYEQTRVECRSDVLVYTSEELTEPLEIVGDVELHLFASSSAPDTDFVAKLCVVGRHGMSINLCDGFLRARLRTGWDTPKLLEPGVVEELVLELGPIGYRFEPGERVRVQVTSSAFPHLVRNMNSGKPIDSDATPIVATQTVHHDHEAASYVVLPVLAAH